MSICESKSSLRQQQCTPGKPCPWLNVFSLPLIKRIKNKDMYLISKSGQAWSGNEQRSGAENWPIFVMTFWDWNQTTFTKMFNFFCYKRFTIYSDNFFLASKLCENIHTLSIYYTTPIAIASVYYLFLEPFSVNKPMSDIDKSIIAWRWQSELD